MNRLSLGQLAAGVALGSLAAAAALAAVTPDKAPAPRSTEVVAADERPAARTEVPTTPPARPADSGPILRCWQFGRLILEEPVATTNQNLNGPAVQLKGRPEPRSLQLLDLRNMACLVR
jgi:DMSO/TMAO reductase YedYZ molybdopterin-dependent catalytic subunit